MSIVQVTRYVTTSAVPARRGGLFDTDPFEGQESLEQRTSIATGVHYECEDCGTKFRKLWKAQAHVLRLHQTQTTIEDVPEDPA